MVRHPREEHTKEKDLTILINEQGRQLSACMDLLNFTGKSENHFFLECFIFEKRFFLNK
jgi:hypothetical protein